MNFFVIRRVQYFIYLRGICVQVTRRYVRTENNVPLQEAMELVLSKGVPVNTAALAKNVPRTTLRKALESKILEASVKSVNPKKKRYENVKESSSPKPELSPGAEASVDKTPVIETKILEASVKAVKPKKTQYENVIESSSPAPELSPSAEASIDKTPVIETKPTMIKSEL